MDSLYGGHQGQSFVIKVRFDSEQEMGEKFADGASYTDVAFGEYCIIDTPNKNNPTNGRIYRRGMDYQTQPTDGAEYYDGHGAKYVGQVVGPASGTPFFSMGDMGSIDDQLELAKNDTGPWQDDPVEPDFRFPIPDDGDANGFVVSGDLEEVDTEPEHDSLWIGSFNKDSNSLVPGKTEDGEFNDEIKYTWLNIRRYDEDNSSWFYVGFEIPYLVNEFEAESVSPYDEEGVVAENLNVGIEKLPDGFEEDGTEADHPFYDKWSLKVPKGIKGDSLRNFKWINIRKNNDAPEPRVYSINSLGINEDGTANFDNLSFYEGWESDVVNAEGVSEKDGAPHKILVYEYLVYDEKQNPDPIYFYIGDYNVIDNVSFTDDGTFVVEYSHDKDFEEQFTWPMQVVYDTDKCEISIIYNNTTLRDESEGSADTVIKLEEDGFDRLKRPVATLDYITGIKFDTEEAHEGSLTSGKITLIHSVPGDASSSNPDNPRKETVLDDFLRWFYKVESGRDEVDRPDAFNFTPEGTVRFYYNRTVDDGTENGAPVFEEFTLRYVKGVEVDEENGNLKFIYTTTVEGEGGQPVQEETVFEGALKQIESVVVNDDGEDADGSVTISFTDDSTLVVKDGAEGNFAARVIDSIVFDQQILPPNDEKGGTQEITVNYNFGDPVKSSPINSIENIFVRPTDKHLLVLYTDPAKRNPIWATEGESQIVGLDQDGNRWVNNVEVASYGNPAYNRYFPTGDNRDEQIWWRDFGPVKDQAGILVGTNVTPVEQDGVMKYYGWYDDSQKIGIPVDYAIDENTPLPDYPGDWERCIGETDIFEFLDILWPNGLIEANNIDLYGKNIAQKIVTVGASEQEKQFYAYDYTTYNLTPEEGQHHWFYLGTLSNLSEYDIILVDGVVESSNTDIQLKGRAGGLVMQVSTTDYSTTELPYCWSKDYAWETSWPPTESVGGGTV